MKPASFPYADSQALARDSLRYLNVASNILKTINACGKLPSESLSIFSIVKGIIEPIFIIKLGIDELIYANNKAKANQTQKKTYAVTNISAGAILFTTTAISSTTSAFALATYMWGSTIKSTQKLYRAYEKTDLCFLFDDRFKKYQFISKKLKHTEPKSDESSKLTKIKNRLEQQLVAISRYIDITKSSMSTDRIRINECMTNAAINKDLMSESEVKTIVGYLQKKQRKKVINAWYNTLSYTCAAVGITLIAVAAVCPPAAPILLAVGTSLCLASSLCKLKESYKETFKPWLTHRKIRQQAYKKHGYSSALWANWFPSEYRKQGHAEVKMKIAYVCLQRAYEATPVTLKPELEAIKEAFNQLGIKDKPDDKAQFIRKLRATINQKQLKTVLEQCMKFHCKETQLQAKGYQAIETAISAKDMVRFGI